MESCTLVNSIPCASPRTPANSPVHLYDVNWHHMGCSVQTVPFRRLPATASDCTAPFSSHKEPIRNENVHRNYSNIELRKPLKFAKVYPTLEHGCSLQRSARQLKTIASLFCSECQSPILPDESSQGYDTVEGIATKADTASTSLDDLDINIGFIGAGHITSVANSTDTVYRAMPDTMPSKTRGTGIKINDNRKRMNMPRSSTKVYPCHTVVKNPETLTKERLADIAAMFCVQGKDESNLRVSQCDDGHMWGSVKQEGVGDNIFTKQCNRGNHASTRMERLRRAILGN